MRCAFFDDDTTFIRPISVTNRNKNVEKSVAKIYDSSNSKITASVKTRLAQLFILKNKLFLRNVKIFLLKKSWMDYVLT